MQKKTDRHHVIPRTKCRSLGINPNFPGNVVRVKTNKHRAWHILFGTQTPDEAIETIKREWSLSEDGEKEFNRLMKQFNKCARCRNWIVQGREVYYQRKPYHDHCAVQQSRVIQRKKRSKFRVIIGGKK